MEEIGCLAVKIGLDSSGFQSGVGQINKSLAVLNSEFKMNTSALGENAKGLEGLKLKSDNLVKTMELQKQKVDTLETAYNKSVATKGKDSKATQDLEIKLNNAKTALNNMGKELNSTNAQIDSASTKTSAFSKMQEKLHLTAGELKEGFGAVGIATGTYLKGAIDKAISAQQSTAQLTNLLQNQGMSAQTAGQDIKDFTGAITKMSTFSGGEAKEALQTLTEKGISAGDALKMEGTLANVAAGTNTSLSAAASMVADAYHGKMKALVSLGVVTQDELKNNKEVAKADALQSEMEDKIKEKFGDSATATKLLSDMYSGKTQALVDAGVATKGEIKNLEDAGKATVDMATIQDRLNKKFGGAAQTDLNSYSGQMKSMQNQFGSIKTQIGTALLPVLTELATKLSEILKPILAFAKEHPKLMAAILSIVAIFGTLVGGASVVKTITGLLGPMAGMLGGLGGVITGLSLPILAIVAAIGLAVFAGYEIYKNWDSIKAKASELWTSITTIFTNIKTAVISTWESIKAVVLPIIEGIASVIKTIWEGVKTTFAFIWEVIKAIFLTAWTIISSIVGTYINIVTAVIKTAWDLIKLVTTTVWNAISGVISTVWNGIFEFLKPIIQGIASFITGAWNMIKTVTTTVFNAIFSVINTVWTSILNFITPIINSIVSILTAAWNNIKLITTAVWNAITSVLSTVWNGIKTTTTTIWNAISAFFSGLWNGISSLFNGAVNGIKNVVSSVWNSILGVTTSVWNGIKGAIMTPINAVVNFVRDQVNKIKGFFDGLNIKLPHINLPHFKIKGEFSLKPPSVPYLGVDWYASGGIFNNPSVIGVGEAGSEAVLPIDRLDELMAKAIEKAKGNGSGGGLTLNIENFINNTDKDIEQLAYELEFYRQRIALGKGRG